MYADLTKMILAFQRCIICAYEQVPRDMDVFCVHVRTHIFLKIILGFQHWIICAYEQVPQVSFWGARAPVPPGSGTEKIIQRWKTLLSKITIRNSAHVRKNFHVSIKDLRTPCTEYVYTCECGWVSGWVGR